MSGIFKATITVAVYELMSCAGRRGGIPLVAYTRDFEWHRKNGSCFHDVAAKNGTEAKKIAIKQHRADCMGVNGDMA